MKMAVLLVFLLFPVLTFAESQPITWEKEGLKAFHFFYNNFKEVRQKPTSEEDFTASCATLFFFTEENQYSSKKEILRFVRVGLQYKLAKFQLYLMGEHMLDNAIFLEECEDYLKTQKPALFQNIYEALAASSKEPAAQ